MRGFLLRARMWEAPFYALCTMVVVLLLVHSAFRVRVIDSDWLHVFQTETPCGGPCSYAFVSARPGKLWPVLAKPFLCPQIMMRLLKYHPAKEWPPPKEPPAHMKAEFEMDGTCPVIQDMFRTDRYSGASRLLQWTSSLVEDMMSKHRAGKVIGNYDLEGDQQVAKALQYFKSDVFEKRGLVIGSETPWVEVLSLFYGASKVTTVEYGRIHSDYNKIRSLLPTEFALEHLLGMSEEFDFAITYSSVEHSGLGRYGDTLDPFGDLVAIAQAHCALKENGLLCIAVMVLDAGFERCGIAWNAHRFYGKERLQHLTANFEVLEVFPGNQPLICMRKLTAPFK
jgi:hypothetical protein